MRPINDATFLAPDERLREVASILAVGVLRLRVRAAVPGADSAPEILPDSGPTCLEVSADTVLSVHGG